MNGQAADMFPSISVASPDRTVHTSRTADPQSSKAGRKGFSSVLQKLRETAEQDDRRKDDDISSTRKADERASVKETKAKDHSQSRSEQSDSSVKRTESRSQTKETKSQKDNGLSRTKEGDSSSFQAVETGSAQPDESKATDASLAGDESSGKDKNAEASLGAQPHVFPIWFAPIARSTDATVPHQESASNEEELPSSQGERGQTVSLPSGKGSVLFKTADSSNSPVQSSEEAPKPDDVTVSAKAQPQPSLLAMSAAHTENRKLVGSGLTQDQPLTIDNSNVPKTKGSQDAGLISSNLHIDSPGLTPNTSLQKDSHLSLESMLKSSQTERPLAGSDHEGGEGHGTRPITAQAEGRPYLSEHHEGGDLKANSVLAQKHQPTMDLAKQFSEQWQSQHDQRADQAEARVPHTTFTDLQVPAGKLPDSLAVGAFGSLNHGAQAAAPSSFSTLVQTQPGQSIPHVADQPTSMMMRTVVLSVAQPDLGQVNVRVAMTNDVVHTYLSADRPEVGQFLLSGQDRLQSSLQMSGFDMGQFRVDIDRQGAGRSFQQGFSQEQQGRAWNQDSQWMDGERGTHRYDDAHAPLQRRLNLIA